MNAPPVGQTGRRPPVGAPSITASLVVLAILAYLGHSLVMLCSVGGMAVAFWLTANRSIRVRIAALIVGGVGTSFGAEVVHVVHHIVIQDTPDHGGFWTSAFLVGLINVIAVLPFAAWSWRRTGRSTSEREGGVVSF